MEAELVDSRLFLRIPHPARQAVARVAYLTNAYPKVSHSFIRREIAALERQGFDVLRFTVRASAEPLPDPEDGRERARTIVLLGGAALAGASLRLLIERPQRFLRALRSALSRRETGAVGVVRRLVYLAEACRLVRLLEAAGIGHVHAHFGTNPAAVARLAALLGDVGYSFTVHGPDEFDAPLALALPRKIADARFVAAVSAYGRGQLMRWSRIEDWPKLQIVRCGADRAFLDGAPDTCSGLKSRTLLCVARLSAQKGLPLLLDAAAQLVADGVRFQLRVVGDGELRPQIEARIASLGLNRHVRLLGWRSAADIRSLIGSSRAFVLPSFAEGLPVVLMEALALGRPVIATAVAGVPELVDPTCGWLVPSGSAEALAEAMRAALDADPATLQAMGALGRARVAAAHDADVNAAALAALLRPFAARE